MKRVIAIILAVLFITLLLPLAVVHIIGVKNEHTESEAGDKEVVSVYIADEDEVRDMEVGEYLKCVVAAEMPAEFEAEALKAQAVAARTYLYSRMKQAETGGFAEEHKGAVICTDYKHCQGYISEEQRRRSWGGDADANWDKISTAVDSTEGEYMTYNGEIISALFHSTSSGATEAAVDVWGSDVPYLQSVASVGDMESPKYLSSVTMSRAEFIDTVENNVEGADCGTELYGNINRSNAGGIISIDLGGVTVKGTDFRSMFGLRSTNADIEEKYDDIIITVRGYGHGVGMSQYGANYMAENGSNYEEILKTYYSGIEIENSM